MRIAAKQHDLFPGSGLAGSCALLMLQLALSAIPLDAQTAAKASDPPCARFLLAGLRGSSDSLEVDLGMGAPVRATFDLLRNEDWRSYALPYDALRPFVTPADQVKSAIDDGVRMLLDFVGRRARQCPHEKIVLAGYSLGAEVLGNALGNHDVGSISAAVLFADPWFNPQDPVAAGTFDSAYGGQYGFRSSYPSGLVGKIKSYCRQGDRICQSGAPGATKVEHGRYAPDQACDAARFISARLGIHAPECHH
jgi:Cutinase